jgi:GNAT superfamily N-acetyltransferase
MPSSAFRHPVTIDPGKLKVERFKETREVKSFTCGERDLDEFLTTAEVTNYESQGLGRTYLVYYDGRLVGYFTISNDSLRIDYLKKRKSFSIPSKKIVDAYPAVKIGRLATATDWQNKGIGRYVIGYIAKMALETGTKSGVRLLILEAKPKSVGFYERCGFELTYETGRERGKVNRTMFLDLQSVDDLLPKK